jgi:hypothetical protein
VELQGGKKSVKEKFSGIDIPKMDNVAFWDNIEWETTTAQHTPTPICNVGIFVRKFGDVKGNRGKPTSVHLPDNLKWRSDKMYHGWI